MQHQNGHCHQEHGGSATNNNHTSDSVIDRLLVLPMFSMGFSRNAANNQEINVRAKGGRMGLSVKEGCIKLSEDCSSNVHEEEEEEEADDYEMGASNKNLIKIRNGENPNLVISCKKRETKFCSRGHWKPSEDARLKELVAVYGPQNWNLIAEKLQGRSGKSCRLRWYNQLDPKINKTAFTEEEEERLMEAHRAYGNKWAFISRLFPGRTDNSVKNHWHVLMARKYRDKTKSYMKTKWTTSQTHLLRRMQESSSVSQLQNHCVGDHAFMSNYDTFFHGKPHGGLTSQMSYAAPMVADHDQYQDSKDDHYLESTTEPKFIDFLGVGAIQI